MNALELLEDTVNFYSVDPVGRRAVDDNGFCFYVMPDGKRCAIGRFLSMQCDDRHITMNILGLKDNRNEIFSEEISSIPGNLLRLIQNFHDTSSNWNLHGLSETGQFHYEELKERLHEEAGYREVQEKPSNLKIK